MYTHNVIMCNYRCIYTYIYIYTHTCTYIQRWAWQIIGCRASEELKSRLLCI